MYTEHQLRQLILRASGPWNGVCPHTAELSEMQLEIACRCWQVVCAYLSITCHLQNAVCFRNIKTEAQFELSARLYIRLFDHVLYYKHVIVNKSITRIFDILESNTELDTIFLIFRSN